MTAETKIRIPIRSITFFMWLAAMLSGHSMAWAGNWTVRGPDFVGVDLYGVTHSPKGFLAVGNAGAIAKSVTGRDWFVDHVYPGDWLIGVGYGGGHFVSVGWNYTAPNYGRGVIWTSSDGSAWLRVVDNAYGALTRVVYGNNRFVAVGGSGWQTMGGVVASSTNGISWDVESLSYPVSYLKDVVFVEDRFLYAAESGIFASKDGINWTNTGASLPDAIGLAVAGAKVVGVGRWGAIQRSTDGGLTWEDAVHTNSGFFMDVASSEGLFVAVGDQGHIATSADGLSWADRDSGTTAHLDDVAYGDGSWVVVGSGGTILTSIDGMNWTAVSSPTPGFSDVAFGNDTFVAASGHMMRSRDGVVWEPIQGKTASSIAYGNGIFVAVGQDFKVSVDGVDWNVGSVTPKWPLSKVVYGSGQFVAVGGVDALNFSESVAYRSADGTNWTPVKVNSTGKLDSLAFADGMFVAHTSFYGMSVVVGDGTRPVLPSYIPAGGLAGGHAGLLVVGPGYVSVGGRQSLQPLSNSLTGGAYAEGHYFAFGGGFDGAKYNLTAVWVSEDGIAWRDLSPITDRLFRAAAIGHGRLIMVGDGIIVERVIDDGLIASTTLNISKQVSGFRVSWLSKVGYNYQLEGSTTAAAWEPVLNANTGRPLMWSGTGDELHWDCSYSEARRFYRLHVTALQN